MCKLNMDLQQCQLYVQLSIRIDELENKRQFKCTWVNEKLKEEVSTVTACQEPLKQVCFW